MNWFLIVFSIYVVIVTITCSFKKSSNEEDMWDKLTSLASPPTKTDYEERKKQLALEREADPVASAIAELEEWWVHRNDPPPEPPKSQSCGRKNVHTPHTHGEYHDEWCNGAAECVCGKSGIHAHEVTSYEVHADDVPIAEFFTCTCDANKYCVPCRDKIIYQLTQPFLK